MPSSDSDSSDSYSPPREFSFEESSKAAQPRKAKKLSKEEKEDNRLEKQLKQKLRLEPEKTSANKKNGKSVENHKAQKIPQPARRPPSRGNKISPGVLEARAFNAGLERPTTAEQRHLRSSVSFSFIAQTEAAIDSLIELDMEMEENQRKEKTEILQLNNDDNMTGNTYPSSMAMNSSSLEDSSWARGNSSSAENPMDLADEAKFYQEILQNAGVNKSMGTPGQARDNSLNQRENSHSSAIRPPVRPAAVSAVSAVRSSPFSSQPPVSALSFAAPRMNPSVSPPHSIASPMGRSQPRPLLSSSYNPNSFRSSAAAADERGKTVKFPTINNR